MRSHEFTNRIPNSDRLVVAITKSVPQASEIWFYGSRARGDHRGDSDWDILVIVPDDIVGSDFMDIQLALDNLSQKFADHDIQAGHSWTGLYREAKQEGRLLWKRADTITESWQFKNKNKIYELLVNTIDSGPFDGGCVIFAQALELKYGGEIVVLVNKNGVADHAALMLNSRLIDADGMAPVNQFVTRFIRHESLPYDHITSIRAIEPDDLPDAPRNRKLAERIAALL